LFAKANKIANLLLKDFAMSNVIEFLEFAGRTSLGPEQLAKAVAALEASPALRAALVAGNHAALAELLGARSNVTLGLFPADDEGKGKGKDEEELQPWKNVA
jgi:hypothetical protein